MFVPTRPTPAPEPPRGLVDAARPNRATYTPMFRPKGQRTPRRSPRIPTQDLRCGEGELADMSATGMRIRFEKAAGVRVGDVRTFFIQSPAQKIRLTGRVMWVRKKSLFNPASEVGIQFQGLRPELARAIETFAANGFLPTGDDKPAGGAPKRAATPPPTTVVASVPDLYAMLGVDRDVPQDDLRLAYHALAKRLHPDTGSSPEAAEAFATIAKAYRALSDPESRARYDVMLARSESAARAA